MDADVCGRQGGNILRYSGQAQGDVEVCAFLKEHEDGSFKLSLRSKGAASVLNVAKAVGGGGHVKAAGGTIRLSLSDALALVREEIEKELKRCENGCFEA